MHFTNDHVAGKYVELLSAIEKQKLHDQEESETDSERSDTMRAITPTRHQQNRQRRNNRNYAFEPPTDAQKIEDDAKEMMDCFREKYPSHLQWAPNGVTLIRDNDDHNEHKFDHMEPRSPQNKQRRASHFGN